MSNIDIKNLAPILLLVYKRPEKTKLVIEALAANELASESDLFIFSGAPKDDSVRDAVLAVRELIRYVKGFRSVTVREDATYQGMLTATPNALKELCDRFGKVIFVEDDILTRPEFLLFMNEGLEKYKDNKEVFTIGANWPVKPRLGDDKAFFLQIPCSWGWGTWKRAWDCYDYAVPGAKELATNEMLAFNFNLQGRFPRFSEMLLSQLRGGMAEWSMPWYWNVFQQNGLNLWPPYSLTSNVGFDEVAFHTPESEKWLNQDVDLNFKGLPIVMPDNLEIDEQKHEEYADFMYWGSCPA
ncbi:hypothetical protein AGMMS50276_12590 [Synergistales bacterium]|nr:hypothetical protein AGMMS50276_12590 [Synergistales bacterium]